MCQPILQKIGLIIRCAPHLLIVRNNEIRHVDGASGSSTAVGINLKAVTNAIVEENIISLGPTPDSPTQHLIVRDGTVSRMKTFNNETRAGTFIGCWNGTSHDGDLVTDVEAAMIGL